MTTITLDLDPIVRLTHEQFYKLVSANPDIKLERDAEGKLIVIPPTGWGTGDRNAEIIYQLRAWSRQNGSGIAFDSSTDTVGETLLNNFGK